ncbi:MAG: hypothetical protein PHX49_08990 [Bacteroidales bacterium]|nr:hypothetical protein [Bacteroidales bacterium]
MKQKVISLLSVCLLIAWGLSVSAQNKVFIHPGILHNAASLQHIREVAVKHTMPEYGSYELLKSHPCASADYKMKGPFPVISRDCEYGYTKEK